MVGWVTSVSTATCYRLDSLGTESQWGVKFFASIQTRPGAHSASYTVGTGSFPGAKQPGHGINHPSPSSTEVKERADLYLYSPCRPSWLVLGWTLPLLTVRIFLPNMEDAFWKQDN